MVADALMRLGIRHETVAVTGGRAWEAVTAAPDTIVFSLLEAPPGRPWEQAAATAVLELADMRFTGADAGSIWLTTDKVATRALLASAGLPIAPGGVLDLQRPAVLERVPPPWILKPAHEDASLGLDGDPVCHTRAAAHARALDLHRRFPGQPVLAEHFLPGREFNVSLLAEGASVEVLPVAEISFIDFPPDRPPLVGYEAKWVGGSFEDTHTVRRFPGQEDADLCARLADLARRCWTTCGLRGYARVDFRLDETGAPCILEVNANPCLSPGAGFLAAAAQANLAPEAVVARILEAAARRGAPQETTS